MFTVFVPNLPTRWDFANNVRLPTVDVSKCITFGSPRILVPQEVSLLVIDPALDILSQRLSDEYRLGDYILAVGDPVLIGMAIHLALSLSNGAPTSVLRWNRQTKQYQHITL